MTTTPKIAGVFQYYSEDYNFGCGSRLVVAFNKTARKVSLFECFALKVIRVDADTLRKTRPPLTPVSPKRLARLIDEKRREYKRYGLRHPKITRALVAALKQQPEV